MSQTYDKTKPESGVTTFGQLYQILRNHADAAATLFSGTSFPANPDAGRPCFRTDRLTTNGVPKFYVYTGLPALGESGWVELSANSVVGEEVVASRGTKSTLDQRLDVALNEDGTLKAATTLNPSQWFKPTGWTWTYVAATQFKVAGDQTDIYKPTRRLKCNLGASTIYAEVSSASYAAGPDETTITVKNASGNLDNTLVDVEHSLMLPATDAADGAKSAVSRRMLGQAAPEYAADTGTADNIVVTLDPAPTAYFTGMKICVKIAATNTGATVINANGLGNKSVVKGVSTALAAGDLPQDMIAVLRYDGTSFQIKSFISTQTRINTTWGGGTNFIINAASGNYTIGPTGSGADIICSGLDSVPAGAKYVKVIVITSTNTNIGDSVETKFVYNDANNYLYGYIYGECQVAGKGFVSSAEFTISLDAARKIKAIHVRTGAAGSIVNGIVTGYLM